MIMGEMDKAGAIYRMQTAERGCKAGQGHGLEAGERWHDEDKINYASMASTLKELRG